MYFRVSTGQCPKVIYVSSSLLVTFSIQIYRQVLNPCKDGVMIPLAFPQSRVRTCLSKVLSLSRWHVGVGMLLALCFGCTGCATFDPAAAAAGTSSKIAISGHLPQATLGSPYNAVVAVSGGAAPYHFATIAGQFPPGLTINPASGSISGTPKTEGFFNFVLSVADNSENFKGLRILGIGVRKRTRGVAVAVLPFSVDLASGASHQFEAMVTNTGNSAVTWAVSAGKISTTGLFTAPKVTSAKLIQLTATSKADPTRRGVAVINVSPAVAPATLSMAANNLPEASEGAPYSAALHASGGAAPYRWKVASGALPSGFELDAVGGFITGLTQETGNFSFAATVSDSSGQSVSRKLTLDVTTSNAGGFDGPAELPRVYVNSSLADTPAPGAVHVVKSGGNLQAALDSAKCGDTISLEAGGTFSGKVVLRAKNCDDNHWIIVRTSAPDSALPPEGSRSRPVMPGLLPFLAGQHFSAPRRAKCWPRSCMRRVPTVLFCWQTGRTTTDCWDLKSLAPVRRTPFPI